MTASDGYASTVQTTASRVPIRVLDLPQSTYTVTHQLLEDRGVDSLKDALAGVPGVQPTLGEGRRDSFDIRGFTAGTRPVHRRGARRCAVLPRSFEYRATGCGGGAGGGALRARIVRAAW